MIKVMPLLLVIVLTGPVPALAAPQSTPGGEFADAIAPDNAAIKRLCSQYLDFVSRADDWSRRYGENHLAVVNVRHAARDTCNAIQRELRRNNIPSGSPTGPCNAVSICSPWQ
jgi:hypothetical protein